MEHEEKNPISFINEYCQSKKTEPVFKVTDQEGEAHAKKFTVSCTVLGFVTTGYGRSIKQGKMISAENMIKKLRNDNLINPELLKDKGKKNTFSSLKGNSLKNRIEDNPIGCLQEYCAAKKILSPEYNDSTTDRGWFKTVCKMNDIICEGFGRQKKLSKAEAAKKMCEIIFEKQLNDENEIQVNGIDKKTESIESNDEESKDGAS